MRATNVSTGIFLTTLCFASIVHGQTHTSSKEALVAGRAALHQHHYSEAIQVLEDGLKSSPESRDLKIELGRAYLYDHQDERAMQLFREVLREDPGNRRAKLELARVLGYHKDYAESDRLYRELGETNPREAVSVGIVRNLIDEGKTAEAERELDVALARYPNSRRLQQYKRLLKTKKKRAARNEPRPAVWENQGRVMGTTAYYGDSAGNRSWRSSQELDYKFASRLGTRTQIEERTLWNSPGPKASMLWGTSELQFRPVRRLLLSAGGGATRFADGKSRGLYRGEVEVHPTNTLWISGGFSRIPIAPTFVATQFDLVADGWNTRVQWNPIGWRAYASLKGQSYSDSNRGKRAEAELVRWFGDRQFSVGVGYHFRYIGFDQTLLHGYFSPTRYHSHLGVGGVKVGVGRFRGEYIARMGSEIIATAPQQIAWEILLHNRVLLQQWELGADYLYFHLAQDAGPFRAQMGRFVVAYRF